MTIMGSVPHYSTSPESAHICAPPSLNVWVPEVNVSHSLYW